MRELQTITLLWKNIISIESLLEKERKLILCGVKMLDETVSCFPFKSYSERWARDKSRSCKEME